MDASAAELKNSKILLRKTIKSRLNALSYDRPEISDLIFANLLKLPRFRQAKTIAVYIDLPKELPTRYFLPRLFDDPKLSVQRVGAPYCSESDMTFIEIAAPSIDPLSNSLVFTDLVPGAYGILEPSQRSREDPNKFISPREIDVILAPGLAFSPTGARLGRGAGYYDRYIAETRDDAYIVGLSYDEQILDFVPTEPFDRRVDAIVSPTRVLEIGTVSR